MPCSDNRDTSPVPIYIGGHDPYFKALHEQEMRRTDAVAALLCEAGQAYYAQTKIPNVVIRWWKEHCDHDEAEGRFWKVKP